MSKWSWITSAIILGMILGASSIDWSKITTYGVWALVLTVLVYGSGRTTRNVRTATWSGVILWAVALIVYEGILDWRLWQQWHYPIDWMSIGWGCGLIAIVGLPGSYLIARKAAR
jgi:cell shape-determining protein MreD